MFNWLFKHKKKKEERGEEKRDFAVRPQDVTGVFTRRYGSTGRSYPGPHYRPVEEPQRVQPSTGIDLTDMLLLEALIHTSPTVESSLPEITDTPLFGGGDSGGGGASSSWSDSSVDSSSSYDNSSSCDTSSSDSGSCDSSSSSSSDF